MTKNATNYMVFSGKDGVGILVGKDILHFYYKREKSQPIAQPNSKQEERPLIRDEKGKIVFQDFDYSRVSKATKNMIQSIRADLAGKAKKNDNLCQNLVLALDQFFPSAVAEQSITQKKYKIKLCD